MLMTEDDADAAIGALALQGRLFQKPPSRFDFVAAGRAWFLRNRPAIRAWLEANPLALEFFGADNERRNEILAVLGDVVMVAGIGIPVLTLLTKILHFGVEKVMEDGPPEAP